MTMTCDVLVAGLGVTGSAVAWHAAGQGRSVIGLDPLSPPHTLGSSHGATRIIREAYFEDPLYVPLVQRAFELWRALEQRTGRTLMLESGGLMIGPPNGVLVHGALASARTHALPHEVLDAAAIRRRFPVLKPSFGDVGVWEPRAGVLLPEACVAAQLAEAQRAGARLWTDTALLGWTPNGSGIRARTPRGEIDAGALVLAAGPWTPALVPALAGTLWVERVVQVWFGADDAAAAAAYAPGRFPVWIWEFERDRFLYGFPMVDGRIKAARHHEGARCDPDTMVRTIDPGEIGSLARDLAPRLEGLTAPVDAAVCLYTNTADSHFLVDALPGSPGVMVASPCSGHGFKFGPALGEAIADWIATGVRPPSLARFAWRAPAPA